MGNSESKLDKEITEFYKQKREKAVAGKTLTKEQIEALDYFINFEEKCEKNRGITFRFEMDKAVPIMGIGLLQDDENFLETEKGYFRYLENLKNNGEIPTDPEGKESDAT